ncbi:acetyl-CoA carboxylase biotin carboxyl carrier protein [Halalkalibacter alkalisediminis]|uniref:Biotin carboxyl carrier protein of acetyl-CoA carboxylase n=1 Tax=Halalkalibacter alkalisediminis TaxID=935616 RepID=A0ABV6NHL3_9BACI|nr:acetyl-CoA carboxylase biotin carboxyl carrier protein [Halalkalibacter alkalisediminis]
MLKVQELKDVIKALDQSNIDELKFEQEGTKLVLKKQAIQKGVEVPKEVVPVTEPVVQTVEKVQTAATSSTNTAQQPMTNVNVHTITSPMVGTFYSAPTPDADSYVKPGTQVTEESVVCIVEAMKLMNEIEAEVKGKIIEILAENGELVEYGQPLFVIELT